MILYLIAAFMLGITLGCLIFATFVKKRLKGSKREDRGGDPLTKSFLNILKH